MFRRKRQLALSGNDDDESIIISTNFTETDIQQITSLGNIQILVNVNPTEGKWMRLWQINVIIETTSIIHFCTLKKNVFLHVEIIKYEKDMVSVFKN